MLLKNLAAIRRDPFFLLPLLLLVLELRGSGVGKGAGGEGWWCAAGGSKSAVWAQHCTAQYEHSTVSVECYTDSTMLSVLSV